MPKDMIAWQHERSGFFSVKTAYRVGLRLAHQDQISATSSSGPLGVTSQFGKRFGNVISRGRCEFCVEGLI
jgi:hypothetical protein